MSHPTKFYYGLSSTFFTFMLPVPLFTSINIKTVLMTWDRKWFLLRHTVVDNAGVVYCVGLVRVVLKYADGEDPETGKSIKGKTYRFWDALKDWGYVSFFSVFLLLLMQGLKLTIRRF